MAARVPGPGAMTVRAGTGRLAADAGCFWGSLVYAVLLGSGDVVIDLGSVMDTERTVLVLIGLLAGPLRPTGRRVGLVAGTEVLAMAMSAGLAGTLDLVPDPAELPGRWADR